MAHKSLLYLLLLYISTLSGAAQDAPSPSPGGEAARAQPDTRAGEIQAARMRKALTPEVPKPIERRLQWFKDRRISERLSSGVGNVRLRFGGLMDGSGFALGPEYRRRDLLGDRATFRVSVRGSTRQYYIA